uniref:Endonuclease/exonuclease/phosphatase domain-containing protein n=1 Tax=Rhodnius prolixus TaxID=13249 RepID=T1HDE0_RHOPR
MLETFGILWAEIQDKFSGVNIFVGGDLNCRIGSANNGDEFLFEGTTLETYRFSRDAVINSRGEKLLEFLELNGLYVINGRSVSDSEGDFTYVGTRGRSVADLLLVNFCGLNS